FEVSINDAAGAEWLEWQRRFIHEDGYGYLAQDSGTDFASGLAAGGRGATASLTGQTAATERQFEIGTAYMLSKEGQQKQVPTGGSAPHRARTQSQDLPDAAAEHFRFLGGPEEAAPGHIGTGHVPIVQAAAGTRSVQGLVAENPDYQVALDQLENARTAVSTTWDQGSITDIGAAMGRVF